MSDLKPCAHCGSDNVTQYRDNEWRFVQCQGCGLMLRYHVSVKESIVAAWNRRVDPNPWRYPERGELLREVIERIALSGNQTTTRIPSTR